MCLCVSQDREELFAYEINWQVVEAHNIIQSKMRPWIVKKIIEYLGEEEKTLTEFILTKLGQRSPPQVRIVFSTMRVSLSVVAGVCVSIGLGPFHDDFNGKDACN